MGTAVGSSRPWAPGLVVGAGIALAGLAPRCRRPALLVLAVGVVASGLAHRSLAGLDGLTERNILAEVTLVGDPVPSFGGVRVDVRWGGRRLEARAQGVAADALRDRLAGERVTVAGTVTPAPPAPWLLVRHVAGRLSVLAVQGWRAGDAPTRLANGLRRTLVAGAAPLTDRQRSLFTGLVIGDDRHQPADLSDAFLGAGLTHLLAVSGQNVAFVLVLAGSVLRRARVWPRLLVALVLIGLFGVITRFEPSVLRASAMAAVGAAATVGGRPASRVRVVAVAVTGLLLVDPLLVRSVGFQLSVAASLSIVVLAPRVSRSLPGPAPLREGLGVTMAAQLGVAPVLLHTFGPIPVASLPANLLAVPVAGLVMGWGLTAGLVAGVVTALAPVLHLPTQLALGWLEAVAERAAQAPLGELGVASMGALAIAVGLALRGGAARRVGAGLAAGTLTVTILVASAPVPLRSSLTAGVVRWHAEGTDVVVLGGVGGRSSLGAPVVLEALRRSGVGAIDVLVVADSSVPGAVVDVVTARHPTAAVVAHRSAIPDHLGASRVPPEGAVVEVGGLRLRLVGTHERLVVDAARGRGPERGGSADRGG